MIHKHYTMKFTCECGTIVTQGYVDKNFYFKCSKCGLELTEGVPTSALISAAETPDDCGEFCPHKED